MLAVSFRVECVSRAACRSLERECVLGTQRLRVRRRGRQRPTGLRTHMTRWPERPSLLFALAYSSALHVLVVFLVSLLLVRAFVTGPEQRETIQIATQNGRHPALIALERRRRQ